MIHTMKKKTNAPIGAGRLGNQWQTDQQTDWPKYGHEGKYTSKNKIFLPYMQNDDVL